MNNCLRFSLQKDQNSNLKTYESHYKDVKVQLESMKGLADRVKQLEAEMTRLREEKEELKSVVVGKNEELLGLAKLNKIESMKRKKAEEEKLHVEDAQKVLAGQVDELKRTVESEYHF